MIFRLCLSLLLTLACQQLVVSQEENGALSLATGGRVLGSLRSMEVEVAWRDQEQRLVEARAGFLWHDAATGEATIVDESGRVKLKVHARVKSNTESEELRLETAVLAEESEVQGCRLHRLSLKLPLQLEHHKRVLQAGENGLIWETRSLYYFFTPMNSRKKLLPEPDINIWRYFRSDWTAGDTYTLARWESGSTAPLVLHRGSGFPGWMAVYDRLGGLAIALDEGGYRKERSLEIRTETGGTALIDLHPASASPVAIEDDQLAIRLRCFTGDARKAASALERKRDLPLLPVLKPSVEALLPVSGGIPIAQGDLKPGQSVLLTSKDGGALPLQAAPLAYWPDGSVKWMELVFSPQQTQEEAQSAGARALGHFKVSNAAGDYSDYTLHRSDAPASAPKSVAIVTKGEEVQVNTGVLEAVFAPGRHWWRELKINGEALLTSKHAVSAYLETVSTERPPPHGSRSIKGEQARGELIASRVEVEESGPLRAVIKVEGETDGPYPCRIIIRLAFFADSLAIQGAHTWVVGKFDPRQVFITGLGLEFLLRETRSHVEAEWSFGSEWDKRGKQGKQLNASVKEKAALIALHPDASVVALEEGGLRQQVEVGSNLVNAMGISYERFGISAALRDMRKIFPAGIVAERSKDRLRFGLEFWPRDAAPMDLRRYSDLPHRAQGESLTSPHNNWVEKHYYPEDPVRGISRTHEFLLHPWLGEAPALPALATALEDRPLIFSGEDEYLRTGILSDDLRDPSFAPVRKNLANFASFLEFHRKKWRWYGKWVYGDIQHAFRRGYGQIVPANIVADLLQGKRLDLPAGAARTDYFPPHDWAFDNGRWGWTNTEGLPNRYLAELYLRTGDRATFFAVEALAQQSRDVIIRHEGRWLGAGTRHGVQPWSDGCHQERMTVPSEYRLHRLLTGDKRSRDVLLQYGYNIYLQPKSELIQGSAPMVKDPVDHSTRLYGLLTLWEATGDPRVGEALARYASAFVTSEGIGENPCLRFPEVERVEPPYKVNSGNMFFQTFGGMYALTEYAALMSDAALTKAICQMAAFALQNTDIHRLLATNGPNSAYFYWPAIAFAARYAPDAPRYQQFIAAWATGPGAVTVRQMVTGNPAHWSGETGWLFGGFMSGALFRVNTLPALVAPLGRLPEPDPATLRELTQREEHGVQRRAVSAIWQDDYDSHSALTEYLSIKDAAVPLRELAPKEANGKGRP